jgi:hypothetical protein
VKDGEDIEFEVVGARFQQGDDSIVVLGKLRTIVAAAKEVAPAADDVAGLGPQVAAPLPGGNDGPDALRKVVVDVAAAKPAAGPARKRQVRLNPGAILNEPPA